MELTKKHLFLGVFCLLLFLFLSDQFGKPDFKEKMKVFVSKATNNQTTHTFMDWLETEKSQLAGIFTFTVGSLFECLPVIK